MRRVMMATAVAMGLAAVGHGDGNAADSQDPYGHCLSFSEMAESLMKARQLGVAMTDVVAAGKGNGEAFERMIMALAAAAYARPRFHTEEMQRREIENFRDEAAASCYKGASVGGK